ncbi:MAG TPA: hypothetical protein VNV44_12900 [Solirubrobacteraceae bacterium]|jgi:hypothetical protein|nr:hypothetical protein [Solirubrobacteraceae bacterium]
MSWLRGKDDTRPWTGGYYPYDLVKELCVATGVIGLMAVLLTILFSSPDEKPSTIAQWSRSLPQNFSTTAAEELAGTSGTATYGPPYNHNGTGQEAWILRPQKWLGVSHPIDTEKDFVVGPLEAIPGDARLTAALNEYKAASEQQKKAWAEAYAKPLEETAAAEEEEKKPPGTVTVNEAAGSVAVKPSGDAGPVPVMMERLLALAKSGGVDGSLLTSSQFFQTDYTKPLLFMADGGLLEKRAERDHLLGEQWGIMNETGSYPGQAWLWLYAVWYQIEPFKSSENADILVMMIMGVLSLALVLIPFIPGVRALPRWIPIYRLIWREHYRAIEHPRADG